MLKSRVLTAVVALPLLLAAILLGPDWLIVALLSLIGTLALVEYRVIVGRPHPFLFGLTLACGLALVVLFAWGALQHLVWPVMIALTGSALAAVLIHPTRDRVWVEVERMWLGLTLIFAPIASLTALGMLGPPGRWLLIFLLATVFASDTGAYFTGRALGKKKLCPTVSPAKTWAGLWGGLICGSLVGLVRQFLVGKPEAWLTGLLIGLGIAFLGALGDLIVSMIKRAHKVKDAGAILPGHGGLMDRLDSFTLAAPWLFLVIVWAGNGDF